MLGYPNPLAAARQQARMLLLGRLARFQAAIRQFEQIWGCTLDDMRTRYEQLGIEDSAVDDAYLEWKWYAEAVETVQEQLAAIAAR